MRLLEIRGKTISYASFKKKMERGKEEMLLKEISTLQKKVTDDNVKLLEDKLNQLQEIRAIKIQGMAVRSKVRWMTEGEKTSKYFCSLENQHFSCKAMNFIEKNDGNILYDQTYSGRSGTFLLQFIQAERDRRC